jgi:hypothetical protein
MSICIRYILQPAKWTQLFRDFLRSYKKCRVGAKIPRRTALFLCRHPTNNFKISEGSPQCSPHNTKFIIPLNPGNCLISPCLTHMSPFHFSFFSLHILPYLQPTFTRWTIQYCVGNFIVVIFFLFFSTKCRVSLCPHYTPIFFSFFLLRVLHRLWPG